MNRSEPLRAASVVFLVLAVVWVASAEEPLETGIVQGVVEVESVPVGDVRVVITCSATSDFEGNAITDDSGFFEISGIPLGDFFVQVFDSEDVLIAEGQGALSNLAEPVTVELSLVD